MRVRLLSRASALARLQTALVERALREVHPQLQVECITRTSAGDQDQSSPLWKLPDKGAFTADLSKALLDGDADVVVHSFKDLPTGMPSGTRIAGALPRADARDVLLIRKPAARERPSTLRVLSSSPRRAWLLGDVLPSLMSWPVNGVEALAVRGNIETRLRKLVHGEEHGLVVAKAALDRLLGFGEPFEQEASSIRALLDECRWMVMPMREFPWAPAQGAIALEVRDSAPDIHALLAPIVCARTTAAVSYERHVLEQSGGGCHQALGAAAIDTPHGRVVSIRAREGSVTRWELQRDARAFPRASADRVWPRRDEIDVAVRTSIATPQPAADGFRIARADALPPAWSLPDDAVVWAAGSMTWRRLAARGVWVNGCADGLGDDDAPAVDLIAGRTLNWISLTHDRAHRPDALATYHVEVPLPDDLPSRSHFFWSSGEVFLQALDRWPSIRGAWHASGPGRTRLTIAAAVGLGRTGVWLDRDSWERDVCPVSTTAAPMARWSQLRLRRSSHLRDLCAETSFTIAHLVQPIFVVEGLRGTEPIPGLDGNRRMGLEAALEAIGADVAGGVRHFLLFAVPSRVSAASHGAFAATVVTAIKRAYGDALHLWVDICLCSSTSDGHCAISNPGAQIDLDATLAALEEMTLRVGDAGADGVSPSDMMDGRTAWLRRALDDRGHGAMPLMSYSTKFASRFYGPFRSAAGSAPKHGTREHYQIDVRARTDAIQSSVRCADEGADLLMVKPGMTSLDLIGPIREATGRLVGAYQVSGEYAGLCALGRDGLADFDAVLLETWQVFRRAGAAYIITYGARRARSLGIPA